MQDLQLECHELLATGVKERYLSWISATATYRNGNGEGKGPPNWVLWRRERVGWSQHLLQSL